MSKSDGSIDESKGFRYELVDASPELEAMLRKLFPSVRNKITFYFNHDKRIRYHIYKDTRGRMSKSEEGSARAAHRKSALSYYYRVVKPKREEMKNMYGFAP